HDDRRIGGASGQREPQGRAAGLSFNASESITVSNSNAERLSRGVFTGADSQREEGIDSESGHCPLNESDGCNRWLPEPDVRGMADGLSETLDGGQVNASEGLDTESYSTETPQGFLLAVWLITVARIASQGPRSNEQLTGEFRDTLRLMPYESALGKWETAVAAAQSYLHGMWKACEAIGALRNSSDSLVAVWQSLSSQEAVWAGMAAYYGPFYSEWPEVPR